MIGGISLQVKYFFTKLYLTIIHNYTKLYLCIIILLAYSYGSKGSDQDHRLLA